MKNVKRSGTVVTFRTVVQIWICVSEQVSALGCPGQANHISVCDVNICAAQPRSRCHISLFVFLFRRVLCEVCV